MSEAFSGRIEIEMNWMKERKRKMEAYVKWSKKRGMVTEGRRLCSGSGSGSNWIRWERVWWMHWIVGFNSCTDGHPLSLSLSLSLSLRHEMKKLVSAYWLLLAGKCGRNAELVSEWSVKLRHMLGVSFWNGSISFGPFDSPANVSYLF